VKKLSVRLWDIEKPGLYLPVKIKPIRKVQDWFLNPKDMEDSFFQLKPNVYRVGSVEIDSPRSSLWNLLKL